MAERAAWLERIAARAARARRRDRRADRRARSGCRSSSRRASRPGSPAIDFGSLPALMEEFDWETEIGNSLVAARAGRRRRRDHAMELPAAPDRGQGRAGARRRLHGGRQAERGRAAQRLHARRDRRRGRPAGRRVQPRHRRTGRWSARRSPRTPASTWSRSPARRAPAGASARSAAASVKRVALELGGKSANVILDDADLERAVTDGVGALLPELRPDLQRADPDARPARAARRGRADRRRGRRALHAGDPFDAATKLGPLVSERQRERVRGYIEQGDRRGGAPADRWRRVARRARPRVTSCARRSSAT